MDFDYEVSEKDTDEDARGGEIVRATDVLPAEIHLLPQGSRPFFPGQVMPLLVDSHTFNTYEADDDRSTGRIDRSDRYP